MLDELDRSNWRHPYATRAQVALTNVDAGGVVTTVPSYYTPPISSLGTREGSSSHESTVPALNPRVESLDMSRSWSLGSCNLYSHLGEPMVQFEGVGTDGYSFMNPLNYTRIMREGSTLPCRSQEDVGVGPSRQGPPHGDGRQSAPILTGPPSDLLLMPSLLRRHTGVTPIPGFTSMPPFLSLLSRSL